MLKKFAAVAAVSAFASLSGLAQAQSNTITFSGEVVATTCDPAVTGGNYTVTLDQVAQSKLNAVGQYAALTAPFSIQVVNCPAGVSKVGAVLNSSTYDATTGNLIDTTTYGSDAVQIQVMDGADTTKQVVVGAAAPVSYATVTGGAASIPMTAYYYVKKTAGVNVGKIKTTAVYALRTQ
ncbi:MULTISPECIES: fimbrial protein [unclassified Burkholderia]|uniref:fimbrial protein n=1 Tax=unclassified Burkholderia TaxID=2613784 RepID=UPI002ABDA259|nr:MULTISPECIES: fimbrial protein [unclassified Burkholderia]